MDILAKSWVWQKTGEPTDLVLQNKHVRPLGDDEALIENRVIGLNPIDWKLIQSGSPTWKEGITPGVDASGIVVKVGKNMTHLRLGSRVCYHTDFEKDGSFSTHTVVSGHALMSIPDNLSDESAAAFPCPCLTAWQAIRKIPTLTGKRVLVSGAGGSVGFFLVQLLLLNNAIVSITSSKTHHQEYLKMGVINTFDYKDPSWKQQASDSVNGNKFDAIFDTVSGSHAEHLLDLLGYYGHIVSIQDRIDKNPLNAFTTSISLHEIALGSIHKYGTEQQLHELTADGEMLLYKIAKGSLRLRPNLVTEFDDLPVHLAKMKTSNDPKKYLVKV